MYCSGFRCCMWSCVHTMSSCSCPANNFFNLRPAASGLMYVYSLTLPVTQCFVRIIISYGGLITQPFIFQSMRSSYSMLSNHSAGHLDILFHWLGKYFFVIRSITSVWVCVFVKVHVLESGLIPLLCHRLCSVCSFYVICCHQAKVFAAICVGTIVAVNGCHGCDCERSLLISTLVRALAACIMRTFFLYLGGFLLWCCQFGVVISNPMSCNPCNDKEISYDGEYAYKLLHLAMYGYCCSSG